MAKVKKATRAPEPKAQAAPLMTVSDLHAFKRNPRKISPEQKRILEKGLERFGDLSGVVLNRRNGELVGGNQRSTVFSPSDRIVYTERLPSADEQGTVALGFVVHGGKKYAYREVDWPDADHLAASIMANKAGGEWDWNALQAITSELQGLDFDLELTGFEAPALTDLLATDPSGILGELGSSGFLRREDIQNQQSEIVELARLKPHPLNYRGHPEDQIEALAESVKELGIYRNVVVARDLTILTGHGLCQAAAKAGLLRIPVKRVDLDPMSTRALKILTNDNELGHFAEVDDRKLTELLKTIKDKDPTGLKGTGYDEQRLANLVMVTRPQGEIRDINEAAEWVGMPGYEDGGTPIRLVVSFKNEPDRDRYVTEHDLTIDKKAGLTWSTRWPFTERVDAASVRFTEEEADGD